jgi:hypothetical protein
LNTYATDTPDGMLAQIKRGKLPGWLIRQPDIGPFHIFKVDSANLLRETKGAS